MTKPKLSSIKIRDKLQWHVILSQISEGDQINGSVGQQFFLRHAREREREREREPVDNKNKYHKPGTNWYFGTYFVLFCIG